MREALVPTVHAGSLEEQVHLNGVVPQLVKKGGTSTTLLLV